MVIGSGEFRKTGYFATWWRFVAREHDFTPKMKVFLCIGELQKIRKDPGRPRPGKKIAFYDRLRFEQKKYLASNC